jgi:hypothetical protein
VPAPAWKVNGRSYIKFFGFFHVNIPTFFEVQNSLPANYILGSRVARTSSLVHDRGDDESNLYEIARTCSRVEAFMLPIFDKSKISSYKLYYETQKK